MGQIYIYMYIFVFSFVRHKAQGFFVEGDILRIVLEWKYHAEDVIGEIILCSV